MQGCFKRKNMRNLESKYRNIDKLFDQIALRYGYSQSFENLLDLMINQFSEKPQDLTKRISEDELKYYREIIKQVILLYNSELESSKWFDFFGNYYEYLGAKARFGQFFTPEALCDAMTLMQGDNTGKGLKVSDPACGSGRMLLSYHTHNLGNFVFGEDLDPVCVKMTAINLLLHGCIGEVVCHNSLSLDTDFNFGFQINQRLYEIGLPSIKPIEKSESIIIKMATTKRIELEKPAQLTQQTEKIEQMQLMF